MQGELTDKCCNIHCADKDMCVQLIQAGKWNFSFFHVHNI